MGHLQPGYTSTWEWIKAQSHHGTYTMTLQMFSVHCRWKGVAEYPNDCDNEKSSQPFHHTVASWIYTFGSVCYTYYTRTAPWLSVALILTLKSASHNWCTRIPLNRIITAQWEGMGGCRVGKVRAGTTSPMPDYKGFQLQRLSDIHPLHF